MAGSCGTQFGRAAFRSGHGLAPADDALGVAHLRFRLRGATDADTDELVEQIRELLAGVPERDAEADGPRPAGRDPAADLPADARRGPRPPGRRPARPSSSAPPATGSSSCSPACSTWRAGSAPATRSTPSGNYTGELVGGLNYGARQDRADARASPPTTTSTSTRPGPTPTRSPTCRCSSSSATRSPSTPTPSCARSPRERGWRVMRFEKLGRRLAVAGDRRRWRRCSAAAAAGWRAAAGRASAPTLRAGARHRIAPMDRDRARFRRDRPPGRAARATAGLLRAS